jgi:predicted HTH domain antitoxin
MICSIAEFALSPTLEDELAAIVDTGIYADAETFLVDAVRTLLAARPDLRKAVAFRLYMRGIFSLGKTAEWSGLTIESTKEALAQQDIDRMAEETPDEIKQMAQLALQIAGRVS